MAIVIGAGIAAAGTVGGAAMSSNASKSAAGAQSAAAASAAAQQTAAQKPWMDAGGAALGRLTAGLDVGGQYTKQFSMADAVNSPAEQEAISQGTQSIQNSAAAKGGLIGTQAQSDMTKFAENTGALYENQAYNQFIGEQQMSLGANQSMAGMGQTVTGQVADNNANLALAGANAQAAGIVGSAGAINNGISGVGNQISMLSGLFGNQNPGGNSAGVTATQNTATGVGTDASSIGSDFASTDYSLSDERLKEDAERVGTTDDGLPIYTYRMKGGGPVQMGVMAQDIERRKPSAVKRHSSGFKMVDYSKVS